MLTELGGLLAAVPAGSSAEEYRAAVLGRNVLGKTMDSTRKKTLRHMRELYALDEAVPIFGLLRKLEAVDRGESLPLLALQVAWSRDPPLRATTPPVLEAAVGDRVERAGPAQAFEAVLPDQYSAATLKTTTQNAASSWTQAGHLTGHLKKIRQPVKPTTVAVTMALFLGQIAGYHGARLFIDPFLLFDSQDEKYRALHDEIIKYLVFLRDRAQADELTAGAVSHWLLFREVKQNWLGFSRQGNSGTGLGHHFAQGLSRNLKNVFRNFGEESLTQGSHMEKLGLLSGGVGRDHLSDFTTNLIKGFLLK